MSDLRADYERDGFVAIEGLLSRDEVAALTMEAKAIATGARGEIPGVEPRDGQSDESIMCDLLAIHFPHKASALIADVMRHPRVIEILQALVGPDIKAMQTMLFVKGAGKPGQAWHQDEHYIPTRDRSLCGVWIALDDATIENGCLWMLPGSHRTGLIYRTEPHGDLRFDASEEAQDFPYHREGGVPVELASGGVAFFNGYVLHRSLPNRARSGFRRALVTHYMSARSMLPWAFAGALEFGDDFRDIVMVAGEDPYAWRGLKDVSFPFVRFESQERAARLMEQLKARYGAT